MKKLAPVFLLFLLLTTGCSDEPKTPEEAREKLQEMRVPFDGETFINLARDGNKKMVKIFLTAGMNLYIENTNNDTALIAAAKAGQLELVDYILKQTNPLTSSRDVNKQNKEKETALVAAIEEGHEEVVNRLIEYGVSPNLSDKNFDQATHLALKQNKISILKKLLDYSYTELNGKNGLSETILMQAVKQGNREVLDLLLAKGADTNLAARGNYTPLMMACEQGDIDIVKTLIKNGAKVNEYSIQGETPFIIALKRNDLDLIDTLILNGANVNFSKSGKVTPLQAAIESSATNQDVLYNLIANGVKIPEGRAGKDVLKASIIRGDLDLLKGLTENTSLADVSLDDETLITFALKHSNEPIVLYFIKLAKAPNATNSYKESPLELAITKGYSEAVAALIEKGADVDMRNKSGRKMADLALLEGNPKIMDLIYKHSAARTPNNMIVRAISAGKEDLIPVFLKYGAEPNTYNAKGEPLLWIAAAKGMTHGVEELLKAGAKINLGDRIDKVPPLAIAAAFGNTDTMKILINNKAKLDQRDIKGFTPLVHAVRNIQLSALKMLLKAGANPNVPDEAGRTALDVNEYGSGTRWAAYHQDIKKILLKEGGRKSRD